MQELLPLECHSIVIGSTQMTKHMTWQLIHEYDRINFTRKKRSDQQWCGKGGCIAGNKQHQLVTDSLSLWEGVALDACIFPSQSTTVADTWQHDPSFSYATSAFVLRGQIISPMSKGILVQEADTWMAAIACPFYRHPSITHTHAMHFCRADKPKSQNEFIKMLR